MPTRLLLEGQDLESLLVRVRDEHGPDTHIVSAERVRAGGIAGFFARERFELTVEVPDPDPTRTPRAVLPAIAASPVRRPPVPGDRPTADSPASGSPVAGAPVLGSSDAGPRGAASPGAGPRGAASAAAGPGGAASAGTGPGGAASAGTGSSDPRWQAPTTLEELAALADGADGDVETGPRTAGNPFSRIFARVQEASTGASSSVSDPTGRRAPTGTAAPNSAALRSASVEPTNAATRAASAQLTDAAARAASPEPTDAAVRIAETSGAVTSTSQMPLLYASVLADFPTLTKSPGRSHTPASAERPALPRSSTAARATAPNQTTATGHATAPNQTTATDHATATGHATAPNQTTATGHTAPAGSETAAAVSAATPLSGAHPRAATTATQRAANDNAAISGNAPGGHTCVPSVRPIRQDAANLPYRTPAYQAASLCDATTVIPAIPAAPTFQAAPATPTALVMSAAPATPPTPAALTTPPTPAVPPTPAAPATRPTPTPAAPTTRPTPAAPPTAAAPTTRPAPAAPAAAAAPDAPPPPAAPVASAAGSALPPVAEQLYAAQPTTPATLAGRLVTLGLPMWLAVRATATDEYAAIANVMSDLPVPPPTPSGAGEILVVLGDAGSAVPIARAVLAGLRLDPNALAIAGRNAADVAVSSRLADAASAARWAQQVRAADAPAVVVVETTATAGGVRWARSMVEAIRPTSVWASIDATRKTADCERWLDAIGEVDALAVHGTDGTADPASVLSLEVPVALLDCQPATPHTWATLLCRRLAESADDWMTDAPR